MSGKSRIAVVGILLACLLGPALLTHGDATDSFSLMTWNVRGYPEAAYGESAWFSRVIAAHSAEILCIQEIANDERVDAFLANEEGYYEAAFLDSSDAQDNAIFFRSGFASVEDVSDPEGFIHPAQLAYFQYGNFDAHVLTVHLSYTDVPRRMAERLFLESIAATLLQRDPDLIVAGDFNTTGAYGDDIESLAADMGLEVIYPKNSVGTTYAHSYYDWILVSPSITAAWCICAEVIIFTEEWRASHVSDHRPVVARFEARDGECPACDDERGTGTFEIWQVEPVAECITLLNTREEEADLAGWTISDGEGSYTFPDGTTVPPGATHSVYMTTYNRSADPLLLYLNNEHDCVFLLPPGSSDPVDYVCW